jgi:hypothetical protein
MKLIEQKIGMKMDETRQCKWNCEIKGHKLKVNDISEGYQMDVVVHIMCQNCTNLCFYPSNHMDTNYGYTHSSCPCSSPRPKMAKEHN